MSSRDVFTTFLLQAVFILATLDCGKAPLGSPVLSSAPRMSRSAGSSSPLVRVRAPEYAILGQTVHLYCNFSLPEPHTNFYTLKWFLDDAEVYRFVPEAKRELQRMVFNTDAVKIDLESSKMIGEREHLLVLQSVTRAQSGEYKCQVTMDTPPFQFIQSSAYLSIMVLPERHPVISGLKQTIYLPGDKVSINCTSAFSFPAARLSWRLNSRPVDRWMVTSYTHSLDTSTGLESATLGLNFLVLPEHFRGPEQELWATCKADMPAIHGMEIPMERTLLLGNLGGRLRYHQGGWAAASTGSWTVKVMPGLMTVIIARVTL